jgi:hypothetical protein
LLIYLIFSFFLKEVGIKVKFFTPNFLASISRPIKDMPPPGRIDTEAKTDILPISFSCSIAAFTSSSVGG